MHTPMINENYPDTVESSWKKKIKLDIVQV